MAEDLVCDARVAAGASHHDEVLRPAVGEVCLVLENFWGPIKRHYDGDIMRCIIGIYMYPLVIEHSHGKSPFLIGKPSINGPFSMAMLNNQMVYT